MTEFILSVAAGALAFLAGFLHCRRSARSTRFDDIAASAVVWAATASFPCRPPGRLSGYIEAVEAAMRIAAELSPPGSHLSTQTVADLQRMEGWQTELVSRLLAEATREMKLLMGQDKT